MTPQLSKLLTENRHRMAERKHRAIRAGMDEVMHTLAAYLAAEADGADAAELAACEAVALTAQKCFGDTLLRLKLPSLDAVCLRCCCGPDAREVVIADGVMPPEQVAANVEAATRLGLEKRRRTRNGVMRQWADGK